MGRSSDTSLHRLEVLVGTWKTEGWTRATGEVPAERIDAIDTYEWLVEGVALLHRVEARVGDLKVDGAEIIGYDPERTRFVTQYFGTDGPTAYEAELSEEHERSLWTMRSPTTRFSGEFSEHGDVITGRWERLSDGPTWADWMDITLTKQRP
jgi:hypothetical protein